MRRRESPGGRLLLPGVRYFQQIIPKPFRSSGHLRERSLPRALPTDHSRSRHRRLHAARFVRALSICMPREARADQSSFSNKAGSRVHDFTQPGQSRRIIGGVGNWRNSSAARSQMMRDKVGAPCEIQARILNPAQDMKSGPPNINDPVGENRPFLARH